MVDREQDESFKAIDPSRSEGDERTSRTSGERQSFAGDVMKLVGGTAFAQALVVLASPIITRLYGPEAFGLSALFTSIAGIIAVVACMRYELAIMLPKKDEEAANLLGLSLFFAALVSALTLPVIWIGGNRIALLLNSPGLEPYLWLVPPYVFASGAFMALNYWNSRTRRFGRLSVARVASSIVTLSAQLGAGFAGRTTGGSLIGANVLGYAAVALMLGGQIWRDDGRMLQASMNWQKLVVGLKRYSNFPIFDTWSALLTTIYWQLPPFLLSVYFSSRVVGYYALGMMVVQLPTSLIGGSISQVFFQRASEAKFGGRLSSIVESTVLQLSMLGLFPLLLLSIIGEDAFVVVFGARWAEAGVYVQILAIWMFFVFITSPIGTLFSILEKQKLSLILNILFLPMRVGALVIGGMLGNARIAIMLFSLVGIVTYAGMFFWLIGKSGVSISRVSNKLLTYLAYSMPLLILTALAQWGTSLNSQQITFIGALDIFCYYMILVKYDPAFRGYIREIVWKLSRSYK